MIWRAPAIRAPWIAESPTPPQPNTATVEPGSILRGVEHRADAGGDAASDQRGAIERHLVGIFTSAFSCTSIFSA